MAEPASGPQRSQSEGFTAAKNEKEKRKRSRVTPEQLVHLERFFAMDRSPTAARRKEISDMLGMLERQTQIWFQNRRAKAKLEDDIAPKLVTGYEADLHQLLHEDEPITIIPCTDLSVGTWRRIATSLRKHDLVAYLSDAKRCLTWYIRSSGYGFKMEIPFDVIVDTEFSNAAPGAGLASFVLSRPPTFYLETFTPPNPDRGIEPVRHWKKCTDWTEDQQATKVLRHNLIGSAVQLAHVLRHINVHMSGSGIQLHSPSYLTHSQAPSPDVSEPPVSYTDIGSHYYPQESVDLSRPDRHILAHKRSSSSPVSGRQSSLLDESTHGPPVQTPSGVIPETNSLIYPQYSQHPTIHASQSTSHSSYSETIPIHYDYSRERHYGTSSLHSIPLGDNTRVHAFPGSTPTPFGTPSPPPLLTTPFYPPAPAPNMCTVGPYHSAIPVISGMSSMSNSDTSI
ncbi:hypothetical protein JVU11DRAFT_4212 [Chiua virens]|nr:hypothetical protein JVU11DRAFT_4212 [Chiua virens]